MSTLRNAILSVALLAPACMALASTDCKSTVATVTVETGTANAGFVVELDGGISFAMKPGSVNYEAVLGMSGRSMTLGGSLIARFAADGVRCNAKARRTDLIALVMGSEETVSPSPRTMSVPSTSTTVVTTPPSTPPEKTK